MQEDAKINTILKNFLITTEYPFEDSDKKTYFFFVFIISREVFMLLNAEECSTVFTILSGYATPHVSTFMYLHRRFY